MTASSSNIVNLNFPLDVEDGWPPIAVESMPFEVVDGHFRSLATPLFVRRLSRDDIIDAVRDEHGNVSEWRHVKKSARTTVWLLRQRADNKMPHYLDQFRSAGCSIVDLSKYGCYAVDVPADIPISIVDEIISKMDQDEVAVAFPSMRHQDK